MAKLNESFQIRLQQTDFIYLLTSLSVIGLFRNKFSKMKKKRNKKKKNETENFVIKSQVRSSIFEKKLISPKSREK